MKIYLSSVGCKLNQSEMETMARQAASAGHQIVALPAEADTIILNTCSVTHTADRKSCQLARRLHRANPAARIVLTGCFAELFQPQAAALPGVQLVVGNQAKEQLPDLLSTLDGPAGHPASARPFEEVPRLRTRAAIKIQDGCDNACTYCAVRVARGPQRSRPQEEIIAQVKERLAAGYQEIVLTGVHIGAYGRDQGRQDGTSLWGLVQEILAQTAVPRLRLSSIEPWDIDPANLELWRDPRLCRHLHLPLQSGNDDVLRHMGRRYTTVAFKELVEAARRVVPDIAITTDVIVGFPGETEEQFCQTMEFVEAMRFARVHVFPYSRRKGTLAADMPGQLNPALKRERCRALSLVAGQSALAFRTQFLGEVVAVLWETQDAAGTWAGLMSQYVRVTARCPADLHNQLTLVKVIEVTPQGLRGTLVPSRTATATTDPQDRRRTDSTVADTLEKARYEKSRLEP